MGKTAEEIAAEVDKEIEGAGDGGAGGDAGGAGDGADDGGGSKGGDGAGAEGQDDFSDDDLNPEKVEAATKAQKALDNAGILKRFRKVHGRMTEAEKWKKENSWATEQSKTRLSSLDSFIGRLQKMRPQDAQDKEGVLEVLLDKLMQDEIKDVNGFKSQLEQMLGATAAQQASGGGAKNPELEALKGQIAKLEEARNQDTQSRAQAELDEEVRTVYAAIPKNLSAKPEFKDLPWKDKEWRKEFEELLDDKVMAWASLNEKALAQGKMKIPYHDLAEKAAKIYVKGGSHVLRKQAVGGDGKNLALTRSNNPGGASTRTLPKPGDDSAELDYLTRLAKETEAEMGV